MHSLQQVFHSMLSYYQITVMDTAPHTPLDDVIGDDLRPVDEARSHRVVVRSRARGVFMPFIARQSPFIQGLNSSLVNHGMSKVYSNIKRITRGKYEMATRSFQRMPPWDAAFQTCRLCVPSLLKRLSEFPHHSLFYSTSADARQWTQ